MSYERDVITNAVHDYMGTIKPLMNGTVILRDLQLITQCQAMTDVILARLKARGLYIVGTGAIAPKPQPPAEFAS